MAFTLTPLQQRSLEALLAKMQIYMDFRFRQVARVNPKVESVWEDLAWQQMNRLRITLSGDKSFGPVRYHVAETLMSDEYKRIREFFSTKSQASILAEIVESKETDGQRTHGALEIHDMRTLCKAIDPALESIAGLIQTFMWWDLEDAVDLARFDRKLSNIATLTKHELTPEMADSYRVRLGLDQSVTKELAIRFECVMLKKVIDNFKGRLKEEQGFQIIIAREALPVEDPDKLIDAVAGQMQLIRGLRAGGPLDDNVRAQVAKAMNVEPAQATADKVVPFLENMAAGNKKRLRQSLAGSTSGAHYNLKERQLADLEKRGAEVIGDRDLTLPASATPT